MATISRTTHQLLDKTGKPAKASVASNLWVTRPGVFSRPTFGNTIQYFTTGESYFSDLIATLDSASEEVLIAGWQVNWDALLAPGVRLYDVVYRNAKRGVKFFVMPWDDTNPIQTYETQTKIVLESINNRLKQEKVTGAGQVIVKVAKSQSDRNASYFSHHQKQIVVDRKIAYVGGIDLAYGRFDDAKFELFSRARGRKFLNSYNPSLPPMLALKKTGMADPDLMAGAWDGIDVPFVGSKSNGAEEHAKIINGNFQTPYQENGAVANFNKPALEGNTLNLRTLSEAQPRMPWQDIHCRIEGPSSSDLTLNFVLRWNSLSDKKSRLNLPPKLAPLPPDKTAGIQLLRSAPAKMRAAEQATIGGKSSSAPGIEDDIHTAMKRLIAKADRFIYIESQFFVSDFGRVGGPTGALSPAAQYIKNGAGCIGDNILWGVRAHDEDEGADLDRPPQNGVCAALIERIKLAILDAKRPHFHVYITLPVHPEGSLLSGPIAVQVYWTMQTIAFGSQSLLNGIKRALKARELRDGKHTDWDRADKDNNTEYTSIPTEECFKYVTLLNLRNWDTLPDGSVVTEQIYVHTKLMIVDDLYALLGSANINDRSLLGGRDSELAVLVMDGNTKRADINGKGSQRPVRQFAHELRKSIWKKLFGITSGIRPATELTQAIEQPGSPSSWQLIQQRAQANADLYEAAFPFVPRSKNPFVGMLSDLDLGASILPTWNPEPAPGALASPLPYQEEFWNKPQKIPNSSSLLQVKGFITALPIKWTLRENIHIKYPTSLIVRNDEIMGTPADVLANASTKEAVLPSTQPSEMRG